MEAKDSHGVANLGLKGMVGMIYIENHAALLLTKCRYTYEIKKLCPHGFKVVYGS